MWWLSSAHAATICASGCDFPTIGAALGTVAEGDVVTFQVLAGNYLEDTLELGPNRTVTLSGLGAVTVTNAGDGPVFRVAGVGARLTATSVSLTAFNDRVIEVAATATVQVDDSVLYTIGLVDEGGAVSVDGATFVGNGDLFLDNVATTGGGHLVGSGGATVELVDCTFTGGFARRGGAVLFSGSDSAPTTVTIRGGRFVDNLAAESGGAIAVTGAVDLTVDDGWFEDNAAENGGVIADYGDPEAGPAPTVTLRHTTFVSNTADGNGGAVASVGGSFVFDDCTLRDNTATDGGAVWIGAGTTSIDRSLLCRNSATTGGAIATRSAEALTWWNNRLIENSATGNGGAIDHAGGDLALRHTNLLGNSASVGGAVSSTGTVTVRDSLVGYTEGATALVGFEVAEGWNAFWQNVAGDVQQLGGSDGSSTDDLSADADPGLERYLPGAGCDAVDDFYSWYGALRDRADPLGGADLDTTRADLGAYGGPSAPVAPWFDDIDADGVPPLYDCIEGDPEVYPGAEDLPYDGIDADCDRWSDDDHDRDGYDLSIDCDDDDPARNAGAVDLDGLDGNCDGVVDVDSDGYPDSTDCDDHDPRIHPGAVEDPDPDVDLDCTPPADVFRALEPRTCSTGPWRVSGGIPLGVTLALVVRRRRRHRV
ncbi:MAG: MopE-related protein [Myxococcota bacterium]